MNAKSSPRKNPSATPVPDSSIWAYVMFTLIAGVNTTDTYAPGKSPVARADSLWVTVKGCAPSRMIEPAGAHGSANSVYAHLSSRAPGTSVFMSAAANVPLCWPVTATGVPVPPPSVEQRKDTSFPDGHVEPYVRSSSRPSTNLALPISPMMSGRARRREYHSLSTRDRSPSLVDMFLDHV